jgi:gamma-glutamylputrescine oxidase
LARWISIAAFLNVSTAAMSGPSASYYDATIGPLPPPATARGSLEAEACIIGGGFAGLNTAVGLAERGHRGVLLLEAGRVGHGASGRNGGFVFGGFSRGEDALLRELGPARARRLYHGTTSAIATIRERIARYGIECDRVDGGVLWANWFRDPAILRQRQALLERQYDAQWEWVPAGEVRQRLRTDRYADALFERGAFHFHPLKYVHGLRTAATEQGVAVHEASPAIALERRAGGWRVRTPEATVDARQVVLACGGYLAGLCHGVDAAVLPIATYVMATEPLGARLDEALATQAAVYDTRFAFDYYRPLPDTRLLWGGRISILDRSPQAVERLLLRDMLKVFPQLEDVRIEHAWSGLMSYARHGMPQVGRIDDGLWVAQAFGGHGVAPTTFAGELLAEAIAGGSEGWRDFRDYGLVSALKPAGFVGAQLKYWWLQAVDAWNDWRGR